MPFITLTTLKQLPQICFDANRRRRYLDSRALSPEGMTQLRGFARFLLSHGTSLTGCRNLFEGWTPLSVGQEVRDSDIHALANHQSSLWCICRFQSGTGYAEAQSRENDSRPGRYHLVRLGLALEVAEVLPLDTPTSEASPTGLVSYQGRLWVAWALPQDTGQTSLGWRLQLRTVTGSKVLDGVSLGKDDHPRCSLPFVDETDAGWVLLGRVMPVYKYAAYFKEAIEWRRWHSSLWLDHQHGGTAIIPFDDGWLTVVYEPLIRPQGHRLHRFIAFGPNLGTVASTEPFYIPDADGGECTGLAYTTDKQSLLLAFQGGGAVSAKLQCVPVASVRDNLLLCSKSHLEFPSDLRRLRFLRKEPIG